jgi:hypothetical protein
MAQALLPQPAKTPMARVGAQSAKPSTTPKATTEPSPESTDQLVKTKFRARFRRQMLLNGILLAGLWGANLNAPEVHSPGELTALAAIFVGLILTFINWRCPACNRYLFRRIYPRSCPRCDVAFRD